MAFPTHNNVLLSITFHENKEGLSNLLGVGAKFGSIIIGCCGVTNSSSLVFVFLILNHYNLILFYILSTLAIINHLTCSQVYTVTVADMVCKKLKLGEWARVLLPYDTTLIMIT